MSEASGLIEKASAVAPIITTGIATRAAMACAASHFRRRSSSGITVSVRLPDKDERRGSNDRGTGPGKANVYILNLP
jgi:hypothetical protein